MTPLTRLSLLVLLLFIAVLPARAVAYESGFVCGGSALSSPMAPYFVRDGDSQVLVLAGEIQYPIPEKGIVGSLKAVESAVRRRNYVEIWLCSPGGNVAEGYKLARLFANLKSRVRVPAGFSCASSCTNAILGAYLRIVDPGADFVVHSSSGVSNLQERQYMDIFCESKTNPTIAAGQAACRSLIQVLADIGVDECETQKEWEDAEIDCFATRGRHRRLSQIRLKRDLILGLPANRGLLSVFLDSWARTDFERYVDMVKFYQLMLNDNQNNAAWSTAYSRVIRNFDWPHLYEDPKPQRSLTRDVRKIEGARNDSDRLIVWTEIFTEIEIQGQQALIRLLRDHQHSLGRGAKNAIDILQATVSCRIQSSCYLDRSSLIRLGYHNFDAD